MTYNGQDTFHIYMNNTASAHASQILRAFSSRNVMTLHYAFLTYVRPILEYNSPIWSPYFEKDMPSIESVQKKFTRAICIRCNILFNSYFDRLRKLNLNLLEYRRTVTDLTSMYTGKI